MIKLTVKTRDGASHLIDSAPNLTLMEAIRKAGIYELVALCGGSCSCATCHVFVEGGPDEVRTPASADEDELLESADYRIAASRLACQIKLNDALEGLVVQIAPES
jgi:2Fe-2S ferredoxin